jgi:hypothetical protein
LKIDIDAGKPQVGGFSNGSVVAGMPYFGGFRRKCTLPISKGSFTAKGIYHALGDFQPVAEGFQPSLVQGGYGERVYFLTCFVP